jgi:hypothetical protein
MSSRKDHKTLGYLYESILKENFPESDPNNLPDESSQSYNISGQDQNHREAIADILSKHNLPASESESAIEAILNQFGYNEEGTESDPMAEQDAANDSEDTQGDEVKTESYTNMYLSAKGKSKNLPSKNITASYLGK